MRFLADIWLRFGYPVWNWLPSAIQAWRLKNLKRSGDIVLDQLAVLAPNWMRISAKMADLNFRWTEDPIGGLLDFHQKPWVTVARGKGDCDDWAHVWKFLAKPYGKVDVFVAKGSGKGWHMMTILDDGVNAFLFSNLRLLRTTSSSNKKALETTFYGYDKTSYVVYLR